MDRPRSRGTPQGGVISPLLSNIYLHVLDRVWEDRCAHLGTLVRYADDFVVMCDTTGAGRGSPTTRERWSSRVSGSSCTRRRRGLVDLSRGREGFDFLGCHLRKRMSGPLWDAGAATRLLPAAVAVAARDEADARARAGADPASRCHEDLRDVIADVNPCAARLGPVLSHGQRGDAIHSTSTATSRTGCAGSCVQRAGSRLRAGRADGVASSLLRSLGTPPPARHDSLSGGRVMRRPERPPVSRVREIRTHGLNGGLTHTGRLADWRQVGSTNDSYDTP